MSKHKWLAMRMSDPWYRLAKQEGYPSRAAYKLLYIQEKYGIIREGYTIVDIGSAPGGMLSVEAKLVGSKGTVLAIDTKEIKYNANNIRKLSLNIFDEESPRVIADALNWKRCDVLISDASPNLSGIRELDTIKQLDLVLRVIEISDLILRSGGNLLVKAYECRELMDIEKGLKKGFSLYKRVKPPPSTWKRNSEVYLMGLEKIREGIHNLILTIIERNHG
ncbi:MAG: RlmE family RNA methyltransferase [Nitrososphaerota archaeon]